MFISFCKLFQYREVLTTCCVLIPTKFHSTMSFRLIHEQNLIVVFSLSLKGWSHYICFVFYFITVQNWKFLWSWQNKFLWIEKHLTNKKNPEKYKEQSTFFCRQLINDQDKFQIKPEVVLDQLGIYAQLQLSLINLIHNILLNMPLLFLV